MKSTLMFIDFIKYNINKKIEKNINRRSHKLNFRLLTENLIMETAQYVFFCSHKPNEAGVHIFSQWFPSSIKEDHATYANAEQYMMAKKALLFGDNDSYEKILSTTDPKEMQAFGRKVKNFDQQHWDKFKFEIVCEGTRLKFSQNPALKQRLLQTGTKTIVEAADYDKIWGIGLSAEAAVKIPEKDWPGQNLLGKALMRVRSELKN